MSVLLSRYETLTSEVGRDLKQAGRECEKRLKKTPNDPATLLFQAHLRFIQQQYEETLTSCEVVVNLPAPVAEIPFIRVIYKLWTRAHNALGSRHTEAPILSRLWDRLLNQAGLKRRKDLLIQFFATSCSFGYWEDALKASNQLRQTSPDDSDIYFMQIVLRQLLSNIVQPSKPKMHQTHATLAYMQLKKCIPTPAATKGESKTNTPNISNKAEKRLVFRVLREQQKYDDIRTFLALADPTDDNSEFKLLLPEAYAAAANWSDLRNCCQAILESRVQRYKEHDSDSVLGFAAAEWHLWRYYVSALTHMTTSEDITIDFHGLAVEQALNIARIASSDPSVCRSALLAAMLCATKFQNAGIATKTAAVEMLNLFADKYIAQPYFFRDIRQFVETIPQNEAVMFIKKCRFLCHMKTPSEGAGVRTYATWLVCELNSLKLDFLVSVSRLGSPPLEMMRAYTITALRHGRLARNLIVKDLSAHEDSCLLTGATLERIHDQKVSIRNESSKADQIPLLQALLLLHHVLQLNEHNYGARIVAIRLARRLGMTSIALENYSKLKINQIQHDTLSHVLFHGICLSHPFAIDSKTVHTGNDSIHDPYKCLTKIIHWYDESEERIDKTLLADISKFRYDKMAEFTTFKDNLGKSIPRQLSLLERRRIARLTDRPYDSTDFLDTHNPDWLEWLHDTRDFNMYPDFYASTDPNLRPPDLDGTRLHTARSTVFDGLYSTVLAKDPASEWNLWQHRVQKAQACMLGLVPGPIADVEAWRKAVDARCSASTDADRAAFQFGESVSALVECAARAAVEASSEMFSVTETYAEVCKRITKDIRPAFQSPDFSPPHGYMTSFPEEPVLNKFFAALENAKFTLRLLDLLVQQSKNSKSLLYRKINAGQIQEIRSHRLARVRQIQGDVKQWKTALEKDFTADYTSLLFGDSTGEQIRLVVGDSMTQAALRTWKDSAMDALDGILKVKVP